MSAQLRAVVDSSDLARAMRDLTHGMKLGRQLPVMTKVLLEVRGDHLRMVSATLDGWRGEVAETRGRQMPARITADGEMLVDARFLASLAQELKGFGGPVLLEGQTQMVMVYRYKQQAEVPEQEHKLEIRSTRFGFVAHLSGQDTAEYPPIYQDIDLGDWSFLSPLAERLVAA